MTLQDNVQMIMSGKDFLCQSMPSKDFPRTAGSCLITSLDNLRGHFLFRKRKNVYQRGKNKKVMQWTRQAMQ